MAVTLGIMFSVENFSTLSIEGKKAIYQKANEEGNLYLVRQLNQLGMKPEVAKLSGLNILSNFMDIATKYDTILQYFKKLRQTNRLLTENEFANRSNKDWVQKYSFCRLLGCDHLAKKIVELQLTRIKVPTKVLVVESSNDLELEAWDYNTKGEFFEIRPKNIKVYGEKIERSDRKITRQEIDELIQIVDAAKFTDLNPENVIVAKDGIYFIDTEFKSFQGSIIWGKLGRFLEYVSDEDSTYFSAKVEEKMKAQSKPIEYTGYQTLVNLMEIFNDLPVEAKEKSASAIKKIQNTLSDLEYVGAKKVGATWATPHCFSFNLAEILG